MKKFFAPVLCLCFLFILSGCCTGLCTADGCINGSWQMYGVETNGKLTAVPVVMTFGKDGVLTTIIEGKDIRKNNWKQDGKYIVIHQNNKPSVRLEKKSGHQMEFTWKGDKYKEKGLKLVLKKK